MYRTYAKRMHSALSSFAGNEYFAPLLTALLLVLYAMGASGFITSYQSEFLPAGQHSYVSSKMFGLIAIGLAGIQLILGYTISRATARLHMLIGSALVIAALLHSGLFLNAVYLRTGNLPLHNLIPTSDGAYYHTGLMFGALAFWLLLMFAMTGYAAKQHMAFAKGMHRLGVLVFIFAATHALMIGSEAQSGWGLFNLSLLILFVFISSIKVWLRRTFFKATQATHVRKTT